MLLAASLSYHGTSCSDKEGDLNGSEPFNVAQVAPQQRLKRRDCFCKNQDISKYYARTSNLPRTIGT